MHSSGSTNKVIHQEMNDKFWMKSVNIIGFEPMVKIDDFTSIGLGFYKENPNMFSVVKKTVEAFADTTKYRISKKTGKATKVIVSRPIGTRGEVMYISSKMDCLRKIQIDFSPFSKIHIGDIHGAQTLAEFYRKYGIDSNYVEKIGSRVRDKHVVTGYNLVRNKNNQKFYMLLVISENLDHIFNDGGNKYSIKCIYKGTKKMCLRKMGMM